ncbi:hypothetical protein P9112_004079 [Eukaryota sp. TZLM1-RC]
MAFASSVESMSDFWFTERHKVKTLNPQLMLSQKMTVFGEAHSKNSGQQTAEVSHGGHLGQLSINIITHWPLKELMKGTGTFHDCIDLTENGKVK